MSTDSSRKIIVVTDLEPDDRLALHLLAGAFSVNEILMIGTTVKHAGLKKVLTRRLLDQIGLSKVPVFQGTGGESHDYANIRSSSAARSFENEGVGILDQETLSRLKNEPHSSDEFQLHLVQALRTHANVEVVVLAPPTDLVSVLTMFPKLQKNIKQIHIMGGWNKVSDDTTRTTYNWSMDVIACTHLFSWKDISIKLYSSHIIKESFECGSMNNGNAPLLIKEILNLSAHMPSLCEFIKANVEWNQHIKEHVPSLKTLIESVQVSECIQFTPADLLVVIGMMCATDQKEDEFKYFEYRKVSVEINPSNVDYDSGYKVQSQDLENSNVLLMVKVDVKIFEKQAVKLLQQLYCKLN